MDRWIKAIPTNFTQCILSHVHILECMWNVNVDVCDVQMKLVFQLAVPPAKSPVHKAVSLEGENKFTFCILYQKKYFSHQFLLSWKPVVPMTTSSGTSKKNSMWNPETYCFQIFCLFTFCAFSEAARKVGEIAWGGSCFVMERWKQEKSLSRFYPQYFSSDNVYKYEVEIWNKYETWNMKYGKVFCSTR